MPNTPKFLTTARPGFLRLCDVYRFTQDQKDDFATLSPFWFTEIGEGTIGDCVERYETENTRLSARTVYEAQHDSSRFTEIVTLWFDGRAFAIVMQGGRSGRDSRRRIITDEARMREAIAYILSFMTTNVDESELYRFDYEMPVEAIFDFYSDGVAESLGIPGQPRRRDLYDYAGSASREDFLRPILSEDEHLFVTMGGAPAPLLRQADSYYELVRDLTDDDYARVPSLSRFVDALAQAHGKETGTGHVYRTCETRPANYYDAVRI